VTIHKIIRVGQASDSLIILGGVIDGGDRVAIRDNVECVLVQILHRDRRIQCHSGDDGVLTTRKERCGGETIPSLRVLLLIPTRVFQHDIPDPTNQSPGSGFGHP